MDITMRNDICAVAFQTLTASTDTALPWPESDEKMILVIQNTATSAATLTVKAGNGIQGKVNNALTVPASSTCVVKLDSGRFKNVSGDNKGKIVVNASAALKVGTVALV